MWGSDGKIGIIWSTERGDEMGGELGIKIKKVGTSSDMVHPYGKYDKVCIDLSMYDENGSVLHICGDNDWGYFALDLLKPIYREAESLVADVKTRISKIGDRPEAILLGLNQQRIMDIYCGGKGKCTEIAGIPIARSNEIKAFRYIGNIHYKGTETLPFE